MRAMISCLVLTSLVSLSSCERSDPRATKSSSPTPRAANPTWRPAASESGYALLASVLADPLRSERHTQDLQREAAQLIAEARTKVVRYENTTSGDPLVIAIASEAASAGRTMLDAYNNLDLMSQNDGFAELVAALLGLFVGDPEIVAGGVQGMLDKGNAQLQERVRWMNAFNRSRAAQLMLPEAAKSYAGEPVTPGGLISIDFNESFGGSANYDEARGYPETHYIRMIAKLHCSLLRGIAWLTGGCRDAEAVPG